jgi:hypothetical protein
MVTRGSTRNKSVVSSQKSPSNDSMSRNTTAEEDALRRSSLAGVDIGTDSDEDVSDDEELEDKDLYPKNEQVIAEHADEAVHSGGRTLKRKVPVFKAKSFFKLNNNLISAGSISSKNLKANDTQKAAPVRSIWKGKSANPIEEAQMSSSIYDSKKSAVSPLVPGKTKKERTLGKGWFDMKPTGMDSGLKADIKMVEMRNYLDPKRFYKNPDKIRKVLHTGTVVEGAAEYKTARMTKKERKTSLVGEIIADKQIKDYTKRKYVELQNDKADRRGRKAKSRGLGERRGKGSGAKKIRKLF